MSFYDGKKVLITGGTGMIGSHLAEFLVDEGAKVRVTEFQNPAEKIFGKDYLGKIEVVKADLTKLEDCLKAAKGMDLVFHLAVRLRGMIGNITHPAQVFTQNMLMQTNMIEASRLENVDRYLYQSYAGVYSPDCQVPFREEDGMKGLPEKTVEPFAWVKRMGEQQAVFYKSEFGMKVGIARSFNTFGPRDNFHSKTSHVIPALIKKAEEKQSPFEIWGSGQATREFVYVTDICRGLTKVLEKYAVADPVNIATGKEIKVVDLANMILRICGFADAKIATKEDSPSGHRRRFGSTEKMEKVLDFKPEVSLEEGIEKTVKWFRENKDKLKQYE